MSCYVADPLGVKAVDDDDDDDRNRSTLVPMFASVSHLSDRRASDTMEFGDRTTQRPTTGSRQDLRKLI
jgi:hypothetical protein